MKLKNGVKLGCISPEMIACCLVIEPILKNHGQELIITSCRDGKHSKNSKHYLGHAIDIRIWDLQRDNTVNAVALLLQDALTDEYYVHVEPDHIHIQFNGLAI